MELNVDLEAKSLRYNTIHQVWGQIVLNGSTNPNFSEVDLVVAINISQSSQSYILIIQTILKTMVDSLDENQTLTLVTFNQDILIPIDQLSCTDENKLIIYKVIDELTCEGPTNIIRVIESCANILDRRLIDRFTVMALITDGIQPFVSNDQTINGLIDLKLPCQIYTIGIGHDQNSDLLHTIAHRTGGVYQVVQTIDQIPMIIGSFVNTILNTCATNVTVTIKCEDGARLITLATPYKIDEHNTAKEYTITIPAISKNQKKTII